jgi:hypothetical protein
LPRPVKQTKPRLTLATTQRPETFVSTLPAVPRRGPPSDETLDAFDRWRDALKRNGWDTRLAVSALTGTSKRLLG